MTDTTEHFVDKISKPINAWEKFSWPPRAQRVIYSSWGQYYQHRNQLQNSEQCFKSVLAIKLDDVRALYYSCRARRQMADVASALEYVKKSKRYNPNIMETNYEICKCLGELNDFESAKVELHDSLEKFNGSRNKPFQEYLTVVNSILEDTLGPSLAPFSNKNIKAYREVIERRLAKNNRDTRPLWRILKDQNQCDVVSVIEENKSLISPIEISRNELKFKVANQYYLHKNWNDVDFLKKLCSDSNLLLSPSEPKLPAYVRSQYRSILKFIKMLHAKKPVYKVLSENAMFGKLYEKKREDNLFRLQNQTRRTIYNVLNSARIYREQGRLKKLSHYVDEVFGNYLCYKTLRVMPCKFEYVHEMLNTLALAYIDNYLLSFPLATITNSSVMSRKQTLHDLSSQINAYDEDEAKIMQTQNIRRLSQRLFFARYTIEKAYLLHEIARFNLMYNRFDECVLKAKTAYEIAREGNCYLWAFLNIMLIAKSHATLHRREQLCDVLIIAEQLCYKLKSRKLLKFIKTWQDNNENEIEAIRFSSIVSIKRSKISDTISIFDKIRVKRRFG